jgi:YYY domain-containing protein
VIGRSASKVGLTRRQFAVGLAMVVCLAGVLRLTGSQWGELQHQHPDENHLVNVTSSLRARVCVDASAGVDQCREDERRWVTVREYLDTRVSPLNPYNRGHSSFVYGTLPTTLVRVGTELTGARDHRLFGRRAAAVADIVSVLLLGLLAARLHGRVVGLLAALLSACAALQIQQSHFFAVDAFINPFALAALHCAVPIYACSRAGEPLPAIGRREVALGALFGVACGLAIAIKISIAPLALVLPAALAARLLDGRPRTRLPREGLAVALALCAGGLAAFGAFRLAQPYAFVDLGLNPQWVANLTGQMALASGAGDVPWNLQWARRSVLYGPSNMVVWGLGLPLGLAALGGLVAMGWRVLGGDWRHAPLWIWTTAFVTWQSLQFNPTFRYFLPAYPLLAMVAAWALVELARRSPRLGAAALLVVVGLTGAWATAFAGIYLRDEPRVLASRWIFQQVPGPANLHIAAVEGGVFNQPLAPDGRGEVTFAPARAGEATGVSLPFVKVGDGEAGDVEVRLFAHGAAADAQPLARSRATPGPRTDPRGAPARATFARPVTLSRGMLYRLVVQSDGRPVTLSAGTIANETDFDYTLPFRMDGFDPFGGLYRGDLILQVYWDDNAEKVDRLVRILSEADYIAIPTNHQYAQITRLPERYPLTTHYYRELVGCPAGRDITWCYRKAAPGMFQGRLGFDLVAVFENPPRLGAAAIDDQTAEEAFTFYDHPRVMIFGKSSRFDAERLRSVLESVDLSRVVRLTPVQFDGFRDLMLPEDVKARQQSGGTWSEMFSYGALLNRHRVLAALVWYGFITALGLAAFPLVRLALPGLVDGGYAMSRTAGLLLLGFLVWSAGSCGLEFTRATIAVAAAALAIAGAAFWRRQADEIGVLWRRERRAIVTTEALVLACFLAALLIRFVNPDLWHPSRGGERPMDFSYFNAVLKSTTFPPYDPWFAGGYINYYYYGFVVVGAPVKLLGIVPAVAYNLILPTLFALTAAGAFSLGWNLVAIGGAAPAMRAGSGLLAAFGAVMLGNLGTWRLLAHKLQELGADGAFRSEVRVAFAQQWAWVAEGVRRLWNGQMLPLRPGDWLWHPSRVVPPGDGREITEFPAFTFLYGDLHAHMMAMPIGMLAIAWALATVASAERRQGLGATTLRVSFGALAIGSLYAVNLADIYTYLPLGVAATAYAAWRRSVGPARLRLARAAGAVVVLAGLTVMLYAPYRNAYMQGYNAVRIWQGPFTPLISYLTHWTVLLVPVISWLVCETAVWRTKARWPRRLMAGAAILTAAAASLLAARGVTVAWIALPLAAWTVLLQCQPRLPDARRFVLVLVCTAMLLTALVEIAVVDGDIGRQNTIFKFYLQAWMLLAASAGASAAWTMEALGRWRRAVRVAWSVALLALLALAAAYPITAARDKMRDRWTPDAPVTLDGMAYMAYTQHEDFGRRMDLGQDFRAIRWMQDHVPGSPVIVEAHCSEYRWCTRFTVYTGLPGVIGWNFHQRQQRGVLSPWVTERVDAIKAFYETADGDEARSFLLRYDVRYIVVGQLERARYAPAGIRKFDELEGRAWQSVYRDADTVIYQVPP